jgi:hypothetical protein
LETTDILWLRSGYRKVWDILTNLKDHLQRAQNQQKLYADKHRVECTFEVGDLVYLRIQPYMQASIKKNGIEKPKRFFYGPYKVKRKVGAVAYELKLPQGSKIHNVFHVSCLKRALGQPIVANEGLPPVNRRTTNIDSRRDLGGESEKVKEQGHQGIFVQMEEFSYRGCHLRK